MFNESDDLIESPPNYITVWMVITVLGLFSVCKLMIIIIIIFSDNCNRQHDRNHDECSL